MTDKTQEPVAWINWCAATGKRSVSFECESELASQPLYEGITQNTQYHYSKFHSWFDSELHRQKYTKDHPAYLAAQEAWNAANDAAQHRINRLNAEIEAWKVRFKIAEDALAKLNGPEQQQEPVAWATRMGEYAHIHWGAKRPKYPMVYEVPLYTSPPASKPLTDEQIQYAFRTNSVMVDNGNAYMVAGKRAINITRAIEAAHGIKGDA